ncbi:hypothetical protein C9F11_43770 (plasmid) [Streptomyces sp. YIM 121038]|nr:hypothetical protein C9F11_43770 [Streptomyces sp. YIM 121038]
MDRQRPPDLVTPVTPGTAGPPFPLVFTQMLTPLAERFNRLAEHGLQAVARRLGLDPPLGSPARVTMAVELAPSLDQQVIVPAGTSFSTAPSGGEPRQSFTTLRDATLYSGTLVTAGVLPATSHATGAAVPLAPLAQGAVAGPDECILLVLSRPLPEMTCVLSLPFHPSVPLDGLRWEAWEREGWVPCGASVPVSLPSQAPRFHVLVPGSHTASVFPATGTQPERQGVGLLRCRPAPGGSLTLVADTVDLQVCGDVTAVQGEVIPDEYLGHSDGSAGQSFELRHQISTTHMRPRLEAVRGTRTQVWTMVDSFANSTARDRHFTVDPVANRIRFSPDPLRGALPSADSLLRIPSYHSGGGAAGNVAAGAIVILDHPRAEISAVTNPQDATGGTDPQPSASYNTLSGITASAATALEIEGLVTAGGFGIAAAHCQPPRPGDTMPLLRLSLLPFAQPDGQGRLTPAELLPTADIQATVRTGLGPRLPAGTGLEFVDFPMSEVCATVTVRARPWSSPQDCQNLARAAAAALHRYFCPLPGAGPHSRGWPIGRCPDTGDIHQALADLTDLEAVESAAFQPPGETHLETAVSVTVDAHGLVYSGRHTVICLDSDGQLAATFTG